MSSHQSNKITNQNKMYNDLKMSQTVEQNIETNPPHKYYTDYNALLIHPISDKFNNSDNLSSIIRKSDCQL